MSNAFGNVNQGRENSNNESWESRLTFVAFDCCQFVTCITDTIISSCLNIPTLVEHVEM